MSLTGHHCNGMAVIFFVINQCYIISQFALEDNPSTKENSLQADNLL